MFDYRISAQVADAHRQDLIAEAKLRRTAKATRKPRFPRVSVRRAATRLAIAG